MFGRSKEAGNPQRTRRFFRRRPLRYVLVAVILLGVIAYHAVPTIISPRGLSGTLADDASAWLGAPASISGDTRISFWPRPEITATGFAVARPGGSGPLVYGNAGELSAHIGWFSALIGSPTFSDFTLKDAVVIFEVPEGDEGLPGGALARTVAAMQSADEEATENPGPDTLTLINSTLGFSREGETTIVKAVNGTLEWPQLAGSARFNGTALLDDHATRISFRASKAAALLAGQPSDVSIDISNDVTHLAYSGAASGRQPYLLNGNLSLSTTRLKELMQWVGVDSQLLSNVETASIDGKVTQSGQSLRFSPANVTIAKAKGNGVLDVLPPGEPGPVGIAATMAFGDITLFNAKSSLPAWIDAVAQDAQEQSTGAEPLPKLDLRVSAKSVQLSDLTLRNVASSIIRSSRQASFDIVDSQLDDGTLFAHVGVEQGGTANVEINAEGVHAGPLFRQLGFDVPLETDHLNFEMAAEALLPLSAISQNDVTGTIRFSASNGSLSWLAFGSLIDKARALDSFAFSPMENSPRAFEQLKGEARLAGSTLELQSVTMQSGNDTITLDGTLDTMTGAIKADVTIANRANEANPINLEITGNALAAFARRLD
ncbi:AsmA family protein [Martelella endophytica]|uniref:Uncharacterized protein n=1 Tax=Martelella endophytica TaxID=1486262 RepID=A0A0D5LJZ1_MAREN|nr:AsmA-like C-terminal region-containing protein [Martelella endophytica]AJY44451.1 hypothetical protein TM49_00165 [Martelella endophytica]